MSGDRQSLQGLAPAWPMQCGMPCVAVVQRSVPKPAGRDATASCRLRRHHPAPLSKRSRRRTATLKPLASASCGCASAAATPSPSATPSWSQASWPPPRARRASWTASCSCSWSASCSAMTTWALAMLRASEEGGGHVGIRRGVHAGVAKGSRVCGVSGQRAWSCAIPNSVDRSGMRYPVPGAARRAAWLTLAAAPVGVLCALCRLERRWGAAAAGATGDKKAVTSGFRTSTQRSLMHTASKMNAVKPDRESARRDKHLLPRAPMRAVSC
eukprot:361413-Chlamydomonas_euryale.AAC.2